VDSESSKGLEEGLRGSFDPLALTVSPRGARARAAPALPGESECSALCHDTVVAPTVTREPKSKRVRLDALLVDRGLVETRSKAQALVLAGKVRVGDGDQARRDHKPGDQLDPAATIQLDEPSPYVSRGGHKLAAALDAFGIDPAGATALDVGASTGGFTDVLLQRGARHVYALDVGRGQLAESLRRDDRVTSLERTNARALTATTLPEPIDLAVIDVSFISLDKVLRPVLTTLAPHAQIVALVKPQFEAGKGRTEKGVVRDPAIHREVLERATAHARELGLGTRDVIASPILGPEGNREFLIRLAVGPSCADLPFRIADVTAAEAPAP
jgi:23S rRNA (cytidine1920-2'-O)/16S rRNA (cytidine1409-2'-O)-methyltransferase